MKIQKKDKDSKGFSHELFISDNKRTFPLIDNLDGRFFSDGHIDDIIPLDDVIEFNTDKIPNNLSLYLDSDIFIEKIFKFSGIENRNGEIYTEYWCDFQILLQNENLLWSAKSFCDTLEKESKGYEIKVDNNYDEKDLSESFTFIKIKQNSHQKIKNILVKNELLLKNLYRKVTSVLTGIKWEDYYYTNEESFSKEIIYPLLLKMNFRNVIYNHGTKEYGKDFTFNDYDKFGQRRNYSIQAKAGDVSGKTNGKIDELIGQVRDSFEMPYYDINSQSPNYVSTMIIIISGKFTENAKEKILHKLNKGLHGSIYFIDKQMITELLFRISK
jgi:hypothetical protein